MDSAPGSLAMRNNEPYRGQLAIEIACGVVITTPGSAAERCVRLMHIQPHKFVEHDDTLLIRMR